MMARVASLLSLALMVGGIFTVGSLVAPVVFKQLPTIQAGDLMGLVFKRVDAVLVTSALLLLAAELAIWWRQSRHLAKTDAGVQRVIQLKGFLLAAMLASLCYGVFVVHPQMRVAKAQMHAQPAAAQVVVGAEPMVAPAVGSTELPGQSTANRNTKAKQAFDDLHHRAELLYKLDWFLAVGLVLLVAL